MVEDWTSGPKENVTKKLKIGWLFYARMKETWNHPLI